MIKRVKKKEFLLNFVMKKNKMAPLKPSLREKKRYVAFEIISEKPLLDFKKVSASIWQSILSYLGSYGAANAGVWILSDKYNPETQRGLLRVNRKEVEKLKGSFVFIDNIDGTKVIVRSLGVSGILKKAESKYLNI